MATVDLRILRRRPPILTGILRPFDTLPSPALEVFRSAPALAGFRIPVILEAPWVWHGECKQQGGGRVERALSQRPNTMYVTGSMSFTSYLLTEA